MVVDAADLVTTRGQVWLGPGQVAEAFAVSDGVFVYVGDDAGAAAFVGPGTVVKDAGGAFVMPAFVDAHVHPIEGGVELAECTLGDEETAADVLTAVAKCAADGSGWLLGNGWQLPTFPDGNPTAAMLDPLTPGRPVFLLAADGHSAWLDTEALARAHLDATTPDPVGGRIERDTQGAPTGTLRESAVDLAYEVVPDANRAARRAGLLEAQRLLLAAGVGSVLEANAGPALLRTYRAAQRSGALKLRVSVALETDAADGVAQVPRLERWRRRFDGDGLRVTTAKLFVDGVLESRTAAMLEPYVDTGTTVPPDWSAPVLAETVDALLAAGFEVHAHAIGDAAVRAVLDAVQAARARGRTGRVAIAHLEAIDPADVPRFATLGVDAVFQPLWAWPDEYVRELTLPAVSPEVGARLYPIGELARAGALVAFGSDWSVSSLVPFEGIEVAVSRRDPEGVGTDVLGVDQTLSIEDALAAYTAGAGRVVGLGSGVLAVGAPADWLVLSSDPRSAPRLSTVSVAETWIGGVRVGP